MDNIKVTNETGPGGNVIIRPGTGQPPGSIIFTLADGSEMIRLDCSGAIYIRGEKVDDDYQVYWHLRQWLGSIANIIPPE